MNAKSNKSKSHESRHDSRRPESAPGSSRPASDLAVAPAEENSEIIRRRDAHTTRPGTGDPHATAPGVGLSPTVTDKSLRPSVLRWKSWAVSDSFRDYAERAARGEKLPRFEGSILADPSRMLPAPQPSEAQRRKARLRAGRPTLMNPNSWVWNPWLWASSALAFALALFSFTLWYTAPKDEVLWEARPLTPSPALRPSPQRPAVTKERAPALAASEPVLVEPPPPAAQRAPTPAPSPGPVAPMVAAAAPQPAPKPVAPTAVAPPAVQPPPTSPVASTATVASPLARTPPVDRSAAELDAFLKGLEIQPAGKPTGAAPAATKPPPDAPTEPSAGAPAPTAPTAPSGDPLLVEAPSF